MHQAHRNLSPQICSAEKSILQTDAGVDRNFQRDLGAIGPYEFQGKFVLTNALVPCFHGNLHGTTKGRLSKVSPETSIGA